MSDDYTPGHAYNDIRVIIGEAPGDADAIAPILTLLYKAGHANERAAIVAALNAELARQEALDFRTLPLAMAIDRLEKGEL